MATTTWNQSYSQWMRDNPGIVNAVSERYAGPAQPAPSAMGQANPAMPTNGASMTINSGGNLRMPAQTEQAPTQVQQVQPVQQATDTEKVPMLQGNKPQQPVAGGTTQTGEVGGTTAGSDTKDHGTEGAMNVAKTIASFYTGGAASGAQSIAGSGSSDQRTQGTMTQDAQAAAGGGNSFNSIMGAIGMFKGGGGGKGGFGGFGGK